MNIYLGLYILLFFLAFCRALQELVINDCKDRSESSRECGLIDRIRVFFVICVYYLHTSRVFMQKYPIFAQNLTIKRYELQLVERKKRYYLRRAE